MWMRWFTRVYWVRRHPACLLSISERGRQDACVPNLFPNFDSMPEGNVVLYLMSRRFRIGIVPGRVFVYFAVHLEVVVAGLAFPRTKCVSVAALKVLLLD